MDLTTSGIVCAVLRHGEHGAVVRLLTPEHGLVAGYVRGGGGRRLRPVLQAGNGVLARLVARVDTQLAAATVELVRPRTLLATTRLGGIGLEWLTALTATALSENEPHPRLYAALDGLLDAMALGAAPARWLADVVRYELLLLAELGFGLDLGSCAATGAVNDLAWVSPRSSQAVGRAAGAPYAAKLLALPGFLLTEAPGFSRGEAAAGATRDPLVSDLVAGFTLTGHFLARDVLTGRAAPLLDARGRLVQAAAHALDAGIG